MSLSPSVPPAGVSQPPGGMPVVLPARPDRRGRLRWTQHAWRAVVVWLLGALLFSAAFAISPAGQASVADYPGVVDVLLGLDLILGQVAVALVLLRRRWPLAVALTTMALCALSAFATPAALLATMSLATRRRAREIVAAVVVGTVAVLAYEALVTPRLSPGTAPADGWLNLATTLLVLVVVALIGWSVGARRELVASWRTQAQAAGREQTARVAQARLAERARIAREMHDVLAHRLSVVAMHAGALAYRDDLPREQVAATAETIRANAHTALEELREVLGVLRAEEVAGVPFAAGDDVVGTQAPQPGLSDVPALVAEAETQGERVRLEAPAELWAQSVSLPASTGRHAYRVVQEALTNARKHAPGETATVLLDGGPGTGLTVRVTNALPRGRRPATTPGAGLGLTGMAERVALAGGWLEAGERDAEFVVDVHLPWRRETIDGQLTALPRQEDR